MNEPRDVLIVDDDRDMLDAIMLVLRDAGYPARSAGNGRQALEAVAKQRPALILLDMLMPIMDGWQFARELRARYGKDVPIVVVTAAEHAKKRSDEVGAAEVLPKPFEVDELLQIVGRHGVEPRAPAR